MANRQLAIEDIELKSLRVDHQRQKFSLKDHNFFSAIHTRNPQTDIFRCDLGVRNVRR
jgi:hypothetical protein